MRSMILAADRNGGIGLSYSLLGLPWPRIPKDMAWFKHVTMQHKRCIMGRRTWESMGKLEGRDCHVVTSCTDLAHEGGITVHTSPPPLKDGDIVIGGASMYEHYATEVDVIFLTNVNGEHESGVKVNLDYLLMSQRLRRYLFIEDDHRISVYTSDRASIECIDKAVDMLLDYERGLVAQSDNLNDERNGNDPLADNPDPECENQESAVDNPTHYTQGGVETIDAIGAITAGYTGEDAFCAGNVAKYIARAPFKGNKAEDLQKAQWYLKRLIANGGDDDC